MERVTLVRVLIAGPGDVRSARQAVRAAMDDWNLRFSDARTVMLQPVMWEDRAPIDTARRPQDLINEHLVDKCDICIAVFWARIGTPTHEHPGGAVEEVKRMIRAGRSTMVFFCKRPVPIDHDPTQLRAVLGFEQELVQAGMIGSFERDEDLRKLVGDQLSYHVEQAIKQAPDVSFTGTWVEIKRPPTERPYALVEIQRKEPGTHCIRGCSYFADGKPFVRWPFGDLDVSVQKGHRLVHTFDAKHGKTEAVGVTCYELKRQTPSAPASGSGFYTQHAKGGRALPSHRVDFDLVQVNARSLRHLIRKESLETEEDRGRLIRRMHRETLQERVVISGGPFSGKTTLIETLKTRGVPVVEEAAIQVFGELMAKRGDRGFAEWREIHYPQLQEMIFARHLQNEEVFAAGLQARVRVFLDRSGIDCIAYLQERGLPIPECMLDYAWTVRFKQVFVLDTLKPFEPRATSGRESSYEESLRIRDRLIAVYTDLGYSLELIGQASLDDRLRKLQAVLGVEPPGGA